MHGELRGRAGAPVIIANRGTWTATATATATAVDRDGQGNVTPHP
jgi:hypothetical protein